MYDTNSRDTRRRSRNRSGSREWSRERRERRAEQQEVGQQLQMISLTRWPPTPTPLAFVLRLVIYFINNKMLSATRRGEGEGGELAAFCAGCGLLCARRRHRHRRATWCSMRRQQVAGPVRWAYCAKKKINCVRTHNRAMNQNHTSWLYIDIRLANECPPPAPVSLTQVEATCGLRALCKCKWEQTSCGACPDSEVACHPQLEPQIAATINRTMQIEQ